MRMFTPFQSAIPISVNFLDLQINQIKEIYPLSCFLNFYTIFKGRRAVREVGPSIDFPNRDVFKPILFTG